MTQSRGDPLGQAQQFTSNDLGIIDIAREGLLRTDALLTLGNLNGARVATPGERGEMGSRGLPEDSQHRPRW